MKIFLLIICTKYLFVNKKRNQRKYMHFFFKIKTFGNRKPKKKQSKRKILV